ncbi:IclR family transcriptional regulator [Cupriavidus numazuensis]|uniref:HTH-type transcriptional regulator TsaQ1/TsaQ2 n=1 Tax=Cupriavidus numazuensis TaxID=221992 RepID=A0ABM8TSJ8_9BURK|nr:helix-turn-helix domain-containing protein [Cupriavidus numazuensis]CAG2159299.1 HTH-type transcriptional regulator TsaQ1/TsaQ2 [Cupriavidus numazuensis]
MPVEDSPSTRRLTRESGTFTRTTAGSQTLERGLVVLRAFLTGAPVLTNAELAARTGLPRPTVSRLTHSLVAAQFLEYEHGSEGYRLSAVCLSFANTFRLSRTDINEVRPLMRKVAVGERVNAGLATADDLSMIYLETLREGRSRQWITPGARIPMEACSPGHAYLAALPGPERKRVLASLAARCAGTWAGYRASIAESAAMIASEGYCRYTARLGVEGIACPVPGPDGMIYALNLSFSAEDGKYDALVKRVAPVLLQLRDDIQRTWAAFSTT